MHARALPIKLTSLRTWERFRLRPQQMLPGSSGCGTRDTTRLDSASLAARSSTSLRLLNDLQRLDLRLEGRSRHAQFPCRAGGARHVRAVGPWTQQPCVRSARIALREADRYAVDDSKIRLCRNLTQTLALLGRGHDLFSSLVPAVVGVASAWARTAANISRRINPLNGRINVQYARNRHRVTASAHNTRVSVHSSVLPFR